MIIKFFALLFFLIFSAQCRQNNLLGVNSKIGFSCGDFDTVPPDNIKNLTAILPATITRSPSFTWSESFDYCGIDRYEVAIGTEPGSDNVSAWTSVGLNTDNQIKNLILVSEQNYFSSIRAVDTSGNLSEVISSEAWLKLDPLSRLPQLILRLDPDNLESLLDSEGKTPLDFGFTNSIQNWNDTSGSINIHNFFAINVNSRPTFNTSERSLYFDGINDAMSVPDHPDLNTGTVNQRNFSVVFETSGNINSRQVVYDEGGNIRGMNIFIYNNRVYCGFYNTPNDGDGSQAFVYVSAPIVSDQKYVVTWIFDYTNYTSPSGPDGRLECFVNNQSIGTHSSTSRLFAHSGDIGLGAMLNDTHFETGSQSGNGFYFEGKIFELMIVNGVPTPDDIAIINLYLMDKWDI